MCVSLAHTDHTDLTDFFVGGKSHGFCGLCVSLAHTDSIDLTDFSVGGKSHGLCGGCIAVCGETCQRHVPTLYDAPVA